MINYTSEDFALIRKRAEQIREEEQLRFEDGAWRHPVHGVALGLAPPIEDAPHPTAAIYDYEEIAACMAENIGNERADADDIARHGIDEVREFWSTGYEPDRPFKEIGARLALLRGDAPGRRVFTAPMLDDDFRAKQLAWAKDNGLDDRTIGLASVPGYLISDGHEMSVHSDRCTLCGTSGESIESGFNRRCPGKLDGEACIECGEHAVAVIAATRVSMTRTECRACGWSTATDPSNPRKGHRFEDAAPRLVPPRRSWDMARARQAGKTVTYDYGPYGPASESAFVAIKAHHDAQMQRLVTGAWGSE